MDIQNGGRNFLLNKKARIAIMACSLLLIGISLSGLLAACSPANPAAQTRTAAFVGMTDATQPAAPVPTAWQTELPATITASPSLTATPPLSPFVMQTLKDAFYCLTNNLTYAPNIRLTQFCPGYWSGSSSNVYKLDGTLVRKSLEPFLTPLGNLHWKFTSLTDVKKDERFSTNTNQIYTGVLSTTLTGEVNLECPSGTPLPFQTSVSIPINGEVRISVFDYPDQPHETVQIESWTIQGDPLEDYCAALP
jgi:hypothetical protein